MSTERAPYASDLVNEGHMSSLDISQRSQTSQAQSRDRTSVSMDIWDDVLSKSDQYEFRKYLADDTRDSSTLQSEPSPGKSSELYPGRDDMQSSSYLGQNQDLMTDSPMPMSLLGIQSFEFIREDELDMVQKATSSLVDSSSNSNEGSDYSYIRSNISTEQQDDDDDVVPRDWQRVAEQITSFTSRGSSSPSKSTDSAYMMSSRSSVNESSSSYERNITPESIFVVDKLASATTQGTEISLGTDTVLDDLRSNQELDVSTSSAAILSPSSAVSATSSLGRGMELRSSSQPQSSHGSVSSLSMHSTAVSVGEPSKQSIHSLSQHSLSTRDEKQTSNKINSDTPSFKTAEASRSEASTLLPTPERSTVSNDVSLLSESVLSGPVHDIIKHEMKSIQEPSQVSRQISPASAEYIEVTSLSSWSSAGSVSGLPAFDIIKREEEVELSGKYEWPPESGLSPRQGADITQDLSTGSVSLSGASNQQANSSEASIRSAASASLSQHAGTRKEQSTGAVSAVGGASYLGGVSSQPSIHPTLSLQPADTAWDNLSVGSKNGSETSLSRRSDIVVHNYSDLRQKSSSGSNEEASPYSQFTDPDILKHELSDLDRQSLTETHDIIEDHVDEQSHRADIPQHIYIQLGELSSDEDGSDAQGHAHDDSFIDIHDDISDLSESRIISSSQFQPMQDLLSLPRRSSTVKQTDYEGNAHETFSEESSTSTIKNIAAKDDLSLSEYGLSDDDSSFAIENILSNSRAEVHKELEAMRRSIMGLASGQESVVNQLRNESILMYRDVQKPSQDNNKRTAVSETEVTLEYLLGKPPDDKVEPPVKGGSGSASTTSTYYRSMQRTQAPGYESHPSGSASSQPSSTIQGASKSSSSHLPSISETKSLDYQTLDPQSLSRINSTSTSILDDRSGIHPMSGSFRSTSLSNYGLSSEEDRSSRSSEYNVINRPAGSAFSRYPTSSTSSLIANKFTDMERNSTMQEQTLTYQSRTRTSLNEELSNDSLSLTSLKDSLQHDVSHENTRANNDLDQASLSSDSLSFS